MGCSMSFKQILHKYRNLKRRGWHGLRRESSVERQTCLSVLCLMFRNFKLVAQPSRLRKEKSRRRLNLIKPCFFRKCRGSKRKKDTLLDMRYASIRENG